MEIVKILGYCIGAVVACRMLASTSQEIRIIAAAAVCAAVFLKLMGPINTILSQIRLMVSESGADNDYIVILFKALGICYLTEITASICRDSGENAIASQAELAGRIGIIITALPLLSAVTELVKELLI